MLIERDYMNRRKRLYARMPIIFAGKRTTRYTPTQWVNVIICILAILIIGFILSHILR